MRRLTTEQEATLRQLRREVDNLQDELARTERASADTKNRLFYARERLREFTTDLRAQGFLI
jgi:chromosome segregation ATPase